MKDREVKGRCAKNKQQWYDSEAGEAKEAASKGEHKTLYRIVKKLTDQLMQSANKDGRWQNC